MDLQALLVVLVLAGISSIPFIIMWQKRRQAQARALHQLAELAHRRGATITRHEHGFDFTVGIDSSKKLAFFLKQNKGSTNLLEADLGMMSGCQVKRSSRKSVNGSAYQSLDRIALEFTLKDPKHEEVTFTFFSSEDRVQPAMDLEQAETWAQVFRDCIGK